MPVAQVMKVDVGEKYRWNESNKDEINSLQELEVYEELSPTEANNRYWSKKIHTKMIPAKLVLVKTQYMRIKNRRGHRRGNQVA